MSSTDLQCNDSIGRSVDHFSEWARAQDQWQLVKLIFAIVLTDHDVDSPAAVHTNTLINATLTESHQNVGHWLSRGRRTLDNTCQVGIYLLFSAVEIPNSFLPIVACFCQVGIDGV